MMVREDVTPWLAGLTRLANEVDAATFARASAPLRAFQLYVSAYTPTGGLTAEQHTELRAIQQSLSPKDTNPLSRAESAVAVICAALGRTSNHELRPAVRSAILTAWITFAHAVFDDGETSIALTVARRIAVDAETAEAVALAARARLLEGFIYLRTADLAAAEHVLHYAERLGARAGERSVVLRSRVGYANIAWMRGNLPEAEARLTRLTRVARGAAYDVLPTVLLMRAAVAHARGQYTDAVVWALRSLQASDDATQEARALAELASLLTEFPDSFLCDTAARALEHITEHGPEQSGRHHAAVSLTCLAIDRGDLSAFMRWRDYLAERELRHELRPRHAVNYNLYRAKGARIFALDDERTRWLRAAAQIADAHRLAQMSFAVEAEAGLSVSVTHPSRERHDADTSPFQANVAREPIGPDSATVNREEPAAARAPVPRRVHRVAETLNAFLDAAHVA